METTADTQYSCRVCGGTTLKQTLLVREMMYGTRESFEYHSCGDCGSIQIARIPDGETLAKHYPKNYYSFGDTQPRATVARLLRSWRNKHLLGQYNFPGLLLARMRPVAELSRLGRLGIKPECKILDVGCGSNPAILNDLAISSYSNIMGVDPYIVESTRTDCGVSIQKGELSDLNTQFDFIMMNHSFEHVTDPWRTMRELAKLLPAAAYCLIRTPTTSSAAYEAYGPDWWALDAPRHLFVPSRSGMEILAASAGFEVEFIEDESTRIQFTASELFRRNIPLREQQDSVAFTQAELRAYDRSSVKLNAEHRGDCVAFVLRRVACA